MTNDEWRSHRSSPILCQWDFHEEGVLRLSYKRRVAAIRRRIGPILYNGLNGHLQTRSDERTTLNKTTPTELRLAEVIGALSIATDLGMGNPLEYALCSCVLAMRLGEALGLGAEDLREV